MISHLDVFNPLLFLFILDEVVVLISIPSILGVGDSFSLVLEVFYTHYGSLTNDTSLHLAKPKPRWWESKY